MTPEQIEKVQRSFAKIVPFRDEAGLIFYGRLFNIAPDARPLFHGDMDEQARKLMAMLAQVVDGLTHLEVIVPVAQALAVKHVEYGVTADQYPKVGEALIWTLEQQLGDEFDEETATAWKAAYRTLSDVMVEAAYPGERVGGVSA